MNSDNERDLTAPRLSVPIKAHGPTASACVHVWGVQDVLNTADGLESLARSMGQSHLREQVTFALSVPYFGSKLPHAFVFVDGEQHAYAAVFLVEHRVRGWRTGVFTPVDPDGDITLLASPDRVPNTLKELSRHLLSQHARLVFLSIRQEFSPSGSFHSKRLVGVGQIREQVRTLSLLETLDQTLAQMGARSRRNLRHAARRAVQSLHAEFVAEADLTAEDLVSLNKMCSYPVPDWVAGWRYRSTRMQADGFLSGLRTPDEGWISLIGGRRYGATTIIDWQMNRADFGSLSIGTAMRLFQIEHEIQRGSKSLRFNGGTPHSINNAFARETVHDLLWIVKPYGYAPVRHLLAMVVPHTSGLREVLRMKENVLLTGKRVSDSSLSSRLPYAGKMSNSHVSFLEQAMRLGKRVLRRIAGRRKPPTLRKHGFDSLQGVDTSGLLERAQLRTGHPNDAYNTAYFGVPPSRFAHALQRWRTTPGTPPENSYRFIDIGCGKGRAVLMATGMKFREIIGIELNSQLVDVARQNLSLWRERIPLDVPTSIVHADAPSAIGDLIDGPVLLYIYNPFRAPVLRELLHEIIKTSRDLSSVLDVLYLYPEHESVFKEFPQFERMWHAQIPLDPADQGDGISAEFDPCSLYRIRPSSAG